MKTNCALYIFSIMISLSACTENPSVDLILLNAKIITLDQDSSVFEAVAISKDKISALGTSKEIKRMSSDKTRIIDLKGRTVIPGLIDSHLHPESAALSELEEEIPDLHTIAQLLSWVTEQANVKEKGNWIIMPKLFATRLVEMKQPSLSELDKAAPDHPVFLNGSFGGMINSAAMKLSGITKDTKHEGVLKDKQTGLPTGVIRASAFNLLKIPAKKNFSDQEKEDALAAMLLRYNRYGLTSLFSGSGDFESMKLWEEMSSRNILTARIYQNILLPTGNNVSEESVRETIKKYNRTTGDGNEWVKTGSLKVFLDGGILTGTAWLQEPWGKKAGEIFGIEDTSYRGIVNFSAEELLAIVKVANEFNWSFTVHATGGGSVDMILKAYGEANKTKSVKDRRFSIIHGNFFSEEAILKMKELGVYANSQAAWFYKDAEAMELILGEERMKTFHPNRSILDAGIIINGGSDHMVKWDANSSINPYNPFVAMWSMITRKTERGSVVMPDEAVTRYEALQIYTINNAFASFEESIKGTIEPGKLADMAVLTDDILSCPEDKIREIESVMTLVGGKIVYSSVPEF